MEARIKENFQMDGWDVIIFQKDPFRVLRPEIYGDDVHYRWLPYPDPAVEVPPTFTLPDEALKALLLEAGKVLPATHATERHLLREIEISNRLLNLVEDGWENA